jgi:hypothetical protein
MSLMTNQRRIYAATVLVFVRYPHHKLTLKGSWKEKPFQGLFHIQLIDSRVVAALPG